MNDFDFNNSLGFVINTAAMRLKSRLANGFKTAGYHVTPEHWAVLNCLWKNDAITQVEIAEKVVKDKTNLTRILDVMEKNGYIQRIRNESDRRSFRIILTDAGWELKDPLTCIALEITKKCMDGIDSDLMTHLLAGLNKINKNLK